MCQDEPKYSPGAWGSSGPAKALGPWGPEQGVGIWGLLEAG